MKLSIITVNFNDAGGLERTIKSVISQTFCDYEFIIIDGGSTDGSVEIIKVYSDRIDYWVSEMDRGIYHAMNKGVDQAHGDYCLFLNSGDSFYNDEVLEKLSKFESNDDIIVGKVVSKMVNCHYSNHHQEKSRYITYIQGRFPIRVLLLKRIY